MDDDLPYTLMTYSNGPGFYNNFEVDTMGTNVTRMNLSKTNFINDREYRYSANGFRDSATVHISNVFLSRSGNSLVPVLYIINQIHNF